MTTAAIDVNVLNDLFDNQKKLDDVFDSLFDDDSFLSLNEQTVPEVDSYDSFYDVIPEKSRSLPSLILPIALEIAAIYYGIMYLI